MTDQSNLPPQVPGKASLLEKADTRFNLKDFRAAPVPANLPQAKVKQRTPHRVESAHLAVPANTQSARVPSPDTINSVQTDERAEAPIYAPKPALAAPEVAALQLSGTPHPIDRQFLAESGFIVPGGAVTQLLEEFRIVKRKLLQNARDSLAGHAPPHGQRVLVCSAHSGEGKTFCAINLALSMAVERDTEVLLVDSDFAKPDIARIFGLQDYPGFMDALSDPDVALEDCVQAMDIPGLFVMPAGRRTDRDSEYLSSRRTAEVLKRLTSGAPNRMVIFDSPPALAASPAAELAKHMGQIVMVARADVTGKSALEDAISLLSGEAEIQLLLNSARFSPSGRRFGSYYGEGEDI